MARVLPPCAGTNTKSPPIVRATSATMVSPRPDPTTSPEFARWTDALQKVADSAQRLTVMTENGLAPYTLIGADFEAFVTGNIAEIQEISREIGIIQGWPPTAFLTRS
jgi:tripartite-type tricarboxylate transporter receptor subunit TctC